MPLSFWGFCKCDASHLCPFCQVLTVAGLAIAAGLLWFFFKRKRKDPLGK